jgi:DHA1 family multidrug resistance protein-like MFS transporter
MTLIRPFSLTFTEPIVLAIDLYIGLVYAVLYSYFESFPIVYGEGGYGWSLGVSMLPFAALLVGAILAYTGYCLWNRYVRLRFTFSFRLPLTRAGSTLRRSITRINTTLRLKRDYRCPWWEPSASQSRCFGSLGRPTGPTGSSLSSRPFRSVWA